MRLRNAVLIAVAATAVAAFARSRARDAGRRAADAGPSGDDRPRSTLSLDATPVIVIRAARSAVTVAPSSTDKLEVRSSGTNANIDVEIEIGEAGERELTLDCARGVLEVDVPKGSALRLELSRCAAKIGGLDDVDVSCTRGSVTMKGVAGVVAVNSTRGSVRLSLAPDRPTHALVLDATRSAFAVVLPAGRGGDYDVHEARSSVRHPSAIEGGIPITLHASRASVEIHGN